MTGRVQPAARSEVSATLGQRRLSQQATRDETRSSETKIGMLSRAIDQLVDEITDRCLSAIEEVLDRAGLRRQLGVDTIRASVRAFVYTQLLDALSEHAGEIETEPALIARLEVPAGRAALVELIARLGGD